MCHAVKLILTAILALRILDSPLSYGAEISAIITGESSNIVNLEYNSSFTVFCILTKNPPGVNSSQLKLYYNNEMIETKICNNTCISATVNVPQNVTCETKKFYCKMNKSGKLRGLAMETFTLGRPPVVLSPNDFTCISEHQRYLQCRFPAKNVCDLNTSYTLSTVSVNGTSECKWWQHGDFIQWDSRNGSCTLESSNTIFNLDVRNIFGARTMMFNVNQDDIVKLGKPNQLTGTNVTETSAKVTWTMSELNLSRQYKYEFRLISEYGVGNYSRSVTEPKMISSYVLNDLIPNTNYKFEVRVQVVPEVSRPADDLYWSESESLMFKTASMRPITPPKMAPGAYSLKIRSKDLMSVSIFWEPVAVHLHNGTGFGYRVSAVSDTGYRSDTKVNVSTFTFNNLPIGHYWIQVWSFNDVGVSEDFSEMQIFPRIHDRQPQLRAVFKAGGYNVSWIAPEQAQPSSYTVMYCTFTSAETCHDSTRFVTILAPRTNFVTTQDSTLNFAISANYADSYSSELSWQHCVVAPRTSRLATPKYHVESVTADSMVVRMVGRCEEHSFYERMQIRVRTLEGQLVLNESYDHFVEVIDVGGLESSTDYEVTVTAFDGFGESAEEVTRRCTASSGIWLLLLVMIVFGAAAMTFVLMVAVRKLKYVLDIKVDIPIGLLEDQEDSEQRSDPDEYEEYSNLSCPTIPEETEPLAEECQHPEPASIPEEPTPVQPEIVTSAEITANAEAGSYIEMLSWKRPLVSDQPTIDGNGNYEPMHPPSKHNVIVQSTGYVKMNLFINTARTGNYTQTLV